MEISYLVLACCLGHEKFPSWILTTNYRRVRIPSFCSTYIAMDRKRMEFLRGFPRRDQAVGSGLWARPSELKQGAAQVFWGGLLGMISVPVFTALTQCPAWSGMMLVLGLLAMSLGVSHGWWASPLPRKCRYGFATFGNQ